MANTKTKEITHYADSEFVQHLPCEKCGSSDANTLYSDGHQKCYSCGHTIRSGNAPESFTPKAPKKFTPATGKAIALSSRNLRLDTCQHFGYLRGEWHGKPVQIAPYYDSEGSLVAQKLRYQNKEFSLLGSLKDAQLFGQHRCRSHGKRIVITEGELDALSLSQVMGNKWPVVSVPNGAPGAKKAIAKQLDWLSTFEQVVLMLDMDEPGQAATKEIVELFEPGKCRVAHLPLKDASDMLQAGRTDELMQAVWNANVQRPDGILAGNEMLDMLTTRPKLQSWTYPWNGLQKYTLGCRTSEIVMVTAGSGVGKSQISKEIAFNLLGQEVKIGFIALEESVQKTADILIGMGLNRRIHLLPEPSNDPEYIEGFHRTIGRVDDAGNPMVCLYNHWGSTDSDTLFNKIRYMAKAMEVRFVILDHISIVVSGQEGDERRMLDNTMTALGTLCRELDIGLIVISHLRRPEGKGHEEGAITSLSQLRGSGAIAQLSDIVIGAERNQQKKGKEANVTLLRVLKNRFVGSTGICAALYFDPQTGRINEIEGYDLSGEDSTKSRAVKALDNEDF